MPLNLASALYPQAVASTLWQRKNKLLLLARRFEMGHTGDLTRHTSVLSVIKGKDFFGKDMHMKRKISPETNFLQLTQ